MSHRSDRCKVDAAHCSVASALPFRAMCGMCTLYRLCIKSERPSRVLSSTLCAQSYQHVYLALLYGLLAIKSVLVDDFTALAEGVIGSVRVKPLTRGEAAVLWGGKALYAAWFLALPALCSRHSWTALAALWLTAEAVAGWTLAFMFQVQNANRSSADLSAFMLPDQLNTLWQSNVQRVPSLPDWEAEVVLDLHQGPKPLAGSGQKRLPAAGRARCKRRGVPSGGPEDRQGASRVGRRAGRHVGGLRARLMVLDTLQRRSELPGAWSDNGRWSCQSRPCDAQADIRRSEYLHYAVPLHIAGGAPFVPRHLPYVLPGHRAHRARNVPGVQDPIQNLPVGALSASGNALTCSTQDSSAYTTP